MVKTIKLLNKFVDKNISDILETNVPEHPIDQDNVRAWLKLHEDTDFYNIAVAIANNILNVSYKKILEQFNCIANELYIMYNERQDSDFYIFIPDEMYKSNFVFTLIFYYLCREKGIIFTDLVGKREIQVRTTDLIVIVDDATYSGDQISNHISTLVVSCKLRDATFFLGIPYISDRAKETVSKLCRHISITTNIVYPSSSISFKTILSYMNEEKDTLPELTDKHLLYFDFKLPDSVSIPQTIFAYGYRIDDDYDKRHYDTNDILTFFKGCDAFYKRNMRIEKGVMDIYRENFIGDMCPKPFYSEIIFK
jgi:hypothetical protein